MGRSFPRGIRLDELVERFGGRLDEAMAGAYGERLVHGLASLGSAGEQDLSFLSGARHRDAALTTRAAAVVVTQALAHSVASSSATIVVADPQAYFAAIARWLVELQRPATGGGDRSPSASIDERAAVDSCASVGPHAVIEAGAVIGAGARIGANCFVGCGARIGAGTVLHPGVTVYEDCEVGLRCIVHAGTVIGSDGFGFAREGQAWAKIPQLGRVIVGDDVEIGANCTIDRGALDDTVIGNGCKLDNLIQIAHNVRIGEHSALAGCVGVAGSAVIGRRCMIGGGAGILGHLEICDDVVVSAMSLVSRSITKPGFYSGIFPLMPNADWEKAAANVKHLPALRDRLRRLERTLSASGYGARSDKEGHEDTE